MTPQEKEEFEAVLSGILNQSEDELLSMMQDAGASVFSASAQESCAHHDDLLDGPMFAMDLPKSGASFHTADFTYTGPTSHVVWPMIEIPKNAAKNEELALAA
jgi:hypothetical protein